METVSAASLDSEDTDDDDDEQRDAAHAHLPIPRCGRVGDVAPVTLFLASKAAGYITAQDYEAAQ